MKKKHLLLALLSSSLVLASCGDKPEEPKDSKDNGVSQIDDSNATSEDPTQPSEPEIPADTRTNEQKVKDLFALMALGKTSTFEYEGFKTEYYGNEKGMWTIVPENDEGYESYGMAVVANYGIYNIAYDDEIDMMYLNSIITPNTALKIGDVTFTTKDLGAAAANVTWSESSRTHTFSTTDETFNGVLMAMLGLDDYIGVYAGKKTSFVVNETGTAILNLSLALTNGTSEGKKVKDMAIEGMKISKVDETMNLDFEVLFANPTVVTKTGWSQQETAFFQTYFHQQFALPFPTGASYAINESITQSGAFMFNDYGCGNIVNSYKTQLEGAGFTLNTDESDLTKGIYCYEKTLVAGSASQAAIKEYVLFTWNNAQEQATIYPNGAFVLVAYVAQEAIKVPTADVITQLRTHTLSDGTVYWPTMNIQNSTGATIEDHTAEEQAKYPNYEYVEEFYGIVRIYFATEEEAQAALTLITGQLAKTYTYSSYNDVYYMQAGDDYYTVEQVVVKVSIAYDENGNYLGYIQITIDSYSYEDYYY